MTKAERKIESLRKKLRKALTNTAKLTAQYAQKAKEYYVIPDARNEFRAVPCAPTNENQFISRYRHSYSGQSRELFYQAECAGRLRWFSAQPKDLDFFERLECQILDAWEAQEEIRWELAYALKELNPDLPNLDGYYYCPYSDNDLLKGFN
mgnify:CR=1 FL=1